MDLLTQLLNATLTIGGASILWREIIGNAFGLASAFGGMRRMVWAWPIGIVGNALLFTVFLGGVFHTPQNLDLYGQAGRQVMFMIVSFYGWWNWSRARKAGLRESHETDPSRSIVSEPAEDVKAVQPHWASTRERLGMVAFAIISTLVCAWIFTQLGHLRYGPRLDGVLAGVDWCGHCGRSAATHRRLLPIGRVVPGVWGLCAVGILRVVEGAAHRGRGSRRPSRC